MPFANVNYKRLYYKDWRPNESEPKATLVMGSRKSTNHQHTNTFANEDLQSHGLGSSNNYFTAVIPSLTSQGYRCITFDTTGSSLSPYTQVEQTIKFLADDVIALMDNLSVSKAVFVGHSMSGITGPCLASNYPSRITGLVLIGPVWPSSDIAPVFEDRVKKVEEFGMEVMADTVPFTAVGSKAKPLHHAFIRELILGTDPAGYISLCKVIANAYKEGIEYGKVSCATLVIAGEEDKSAPLSGCERIIEEISAERKDLVVMGGVGHWHCVEDSEEVGRIVVEFLRKGFEGPKERL